MTPLLLTLTLTSPAQPPVFRPAPPPAVVVQPQFVPVPPRPPVVVVPVPVPTRPVYYPPAPVPVVPPAVTLGEFSRYFTPTPGRHDVWVVHPVTNQPVKVCFALPPGKLRDFEVNRRSIHFEFSCGREVDIEFLRNGTVRVDYRD